MSTLAIDKAGPRRKVKYGSMSRDRTLGAALVVFLPHAVCDLLPDAAALHADHLAQEQRGDFGGDQSLVGIPPDASATTSSC